MCAACKYRDHWNRPSGFPLAPSRHDLWMSAILAAKARVCAKCNREQHRSHPQGFDDCTCFLDRYSSVWLCNDHDVGRCGTYFFGNVDRRRLISEGWQCTNFGPYFVAGRYRPRPSCLCAYGYIPRARPDRRDTQQCRMCFKFTVPQVRQSERVRRARGGNTSVLSFQMLAARGRGKIATGRVNQHGFND